MTFNLELDAAPDPLAIHLTLQTGEFPSMADHLLVASSSKTFKISKEIYSLEKVRFSLGINPPENIESGVRRYLDFLYVSKITEGQTMNIHKRNRPIS
jgi:hypothetical protein